MLVKKLLALILVCTFPLLASAQTAPPAQPTPPAGEQGATPPNPPPAKPATPAPPKVTVTPYGFVQGTAYFDQNTFSAKDYPGQVARDQIGGAFLMSARYSRFGVKLALDDGNWTGATLGGEIEFDFKAGQLGTTSNNWYNGVMRLRLADVTATWKSPMGSLQLLAGQNYGIVCPLFATTITWTADPLFWMAGNAWRRDPQFRLTATGGKELLGLNAAVAMLSPHTNDAAVAGAANPNFPFTAPDYGSGNASRMPDLEARVGINAQLDPVTVAAGIGYSYGVRRVIDLSTTPAPNATSKPSKDISGDMVGVDAKIGSSMLDLQGEWWTQKGRSDPYNVIAPAVGVTVGHQKAVESTGYWAQAVLKPLPVIWIPVGYGTEEVKKSSLSSAGITAASTRTNNSQLEAGVIFNAGKYWKFGVEGMRVETKYLDGLKMTGTQLDVSTQFVF